MSDSHTVTTEKAKDPKRVEAGKRLAQISKEAREKKMRAKIQSEMDEEGWGMYIPIISIAGLVLAAASVYYARAQHKRTVPSVIIEEPHREVEPPVVKLDTL